MAGEDDADVPRAEIAGRPLYILDRLLEDSGDKYIGPFAPNVPMACTPGGRSFIYKSEVASRSSAGSCPGGGAPNGGQPVTVFTFRA
ncbi:hypothetical protein ACVWWG_000118 [Bradyrhizobium sp. LB7.2]